MGIVFRQSIKTIIVTLTGAVLGAAIAYLSTKLIPQQQLGYARMLLAMAVIFSQFVLVGMQSMLFVYIHKYPENHPGRPVLVTLSIAPVFILTLLLSVGYVLCKPYILPLYEAKDIVLVDRYFLWLPPYVLFWGLIIYLEHLLSAQMRVAASSFLKEIVLRLLNIGVIVAFGIGLINFDWFIALSVLVHLVPIAALLLMARKIKGITISTNWAVLSKVEYRSIFNFAIAHLLVNLSITLLDNIDIIMIPMLDISGMQSASIYFIAVYIMSVYYIPFRALSLSATPTLTREFQAGNMEKVKDIFKRSSINIWIVVLGMGAFIATNMHNVVAILPTNYNAVYAVALILMLGRTVNMLSGMNTEVISISDHYRFNFYITLFLVILMIILNYILIPKYGIYGAAWGTTIAMSIQNIVKMLFIWQKFRLHPFYKGSLFIAIAAIIAFGIGYIIPFIANPVVDTIIRSLVIAVTYGSLLLVFKPSEDLRQFLKSIKKDKRLF